MKWIDAEDIGIALVEKFPGVDPLTIRFTDLRERVMALGNGAARTVDIADGMDAPKRPRGRPRKRQQEVEADADF